MSVFNARTGAAQAGSSRMGAPSSLTRRRNCMGCNARPARSVVVVRAARPSPDVEYMGVIEDMQTVRGTVTLAAPAELAWQVLTDYDAGSQVYANIASTRTLDVDGAKQLLQSCKWQFLAFSGTFELQLAVQEDAASSRLVFTLVDSSFMRDFTGTWQVTEAPGGGCCIEHMLAVKPVVPIPPAVAAVTSSIFVQQATDVMRDLCAEIARRQEAAVVVEMAVL